MKLCSVKLVPEFMGRKCQVVPMLAAGACLRWTSASDEGRAHVGEDARRAHQGIALPRCACTVGVAVDSGL